MAVRGGAPADRFRWERPGPDFPFYRDGRVSVGQAWLLVASALFVTAFLLTQAAGGRALTALIMLLIPLAALTVVSRGDYHGIVRGLRSADVFLAIAAVCLKFLYTVVAASILMSVFGVVLNENRIVGETVDVMLAVLLLLQLFGEELFKANLLLGAMTLLYRATGLRRMSVVVATVACLVVFGVAHLRAYGSLPQVLVLQGLGSVFEVFAYLRTKNVLVSYIAHVLFDLSIFVLGFLGMHGLGIVA